MKNSFFRKYLIVIGVFSMTYFGILWVLDEMFNGVLLDTLYGLLPPGPYYFVSYYRALAALVLYLMTVIAISVVWIYRFGRTVRLASEALENDALLENRCPKELQEFDKRLKKVREVSRQNEQARKLAEQQKNDLVIYLAHDLKTPLTSVIGYLSLLEEAPDMPAEQRAKYTGIALDKACRLEMLVDEFFEITRLNLQAASVEKAPVNLTVLLLQLREEFYPMLEEKSLTLSMSIALELMPEANGDLLARVFDNLLRNAVAYGTAGTEIRCTARKDGDAVQICFDNQSEPLSHMQMNRLFEKFYRPDTARRTSGGGAGLGLAIAKQIIELHGGSITAAYEEGRLRFEIRLPAK